MENFGEGRTVKLRMLHADVTLCAMEHYRVVHEACTFINADEGYRLCERQNHTLIGQLVLKAPIHQMSLCSERGNLPEAPEHGVVGLIARCMNEVSEVGITSWIDGGQAQSVDVVADETLASKVVCAIDCLPAGLKHDALV